MTCLYFNNILHSAILGEKRKALEMVVDKISVIKRTTKPTELPKIDEYVYEPLYNSIIVFEANR